MNNFPVLDWQLKKLVGLSRSSWLPFLVGGIVLSASVYLSEAQEAQEQLLIRERVKAEITSIETELTEQIRTRVNAIVRMSDRWEYYGGRTEAEWRFEAGLNLKDLKGFQAIFWVDPTYHVRWLVPLAGNQKAENFDVMSEPHRRAAIQNALLHNQPAVTRPITLVSEGDGFAVYAPIYTDGGKFAGLAAATFRFDKLFNTILSNHLIKGYAITIYDGDQKIYTHGEKTFTEVSQEMQLDMYRVPWTLAISPKATIARPSSLPQVLLIGGSITSLLLGLVTHLIQTSRQYNRNLEVQISERRQAELQLRVFESVVVNANDAVLITQDKTINEPGPKIVYANKAFTRMTGYSEEEVRGLSPRLLQGPKTDRAVLDQIRAGLEAWQPVRVEVLNYRKAGYAGPREADREFWVELSIVPVPDKKGFYSHWVSVQRNITKRRQAEEALRKSEERFRNLVENVKDYAIFAMDTEARIFSWNVGAQRLLGYSESEVLGQHYSMLFRPEDVALGAAQKEIDIALRDGRGEEARWHQRKDGTQFWASEILNPLRDKQGRLQGFSKIMRDISERKQADEALAKAHQRLELAQQAGKIGTFEWDFQTSTFIATPELERLYGLAPGGFGALLENWFQKLHPDDQVRAETAATDAASTGRFDTEFRILWPDGSLHWIAAKAQVHKDDTGKPLRMIGVNIDITDRQQAAAELQKAKNSAEAANQAKSEFLATMSHEIRTPMNGVIGMTSLLCDTDLSLQQREFAETIRSSGDALLRIINDILDFSKIEAGSLIIESQPFDLRAFIESAFDQLAPKAAEKGLELTYLIKPDTSNMFSGDVNRLRQILVNLLSNAVKFTEQGEVMLLVSAQIVPATQPSYELCFALKDTGIGIAPNQMDRLFKSFSQVDASTSRQYGGTGLGLAISKQLSELMGGRIWVESQVGQGSTFYFTVVVESVPTKTSAPDFEDSQSQLIGKQLLIVDDHATNRQVLALQAQSWGMFTQTADSGAEALNWIGRQAFDLAIIDMYMPQMDGLTLATEIRKQLTYHQLPLIMLTSLTNKTQAKAAAINLDFAAFLTKPVKQSLLYEVLRQLFSGQPQLLGQSSSLPPPIESQLAERLDLRILVAEDNLVNQKLVLLILKRLGYRADVAVDGLEALAALRRRPYDVVLMDVQMPLMDGLTATRHIRQERPHGSPQIIAMTANAMHGDRQKCLDAGMDDYISKPIRLEEIIRALSLCQPRSDDCHAVCAAPAAAIDYKVLQSLKDMAGEEAVVLELIDCYLAQSPQLLQAIRSAVEQGDAPALRQAAHTLKPSSAALGAIHLSELCNQLEALGQTGTTTNGLEQVSQLEAAYEKVKAALQIEKEQL